MVKLYYLYQIIREFNYRQLILVDNDTSDALLVYFYGRAKRSYLCFVILMKKIKNTYIHLYYTLFSIIDWISLERDKANKVGARVGFNCAND
uniref:Uncharacterized protein n=1 Tax=Salix viminalis TaxID=40686 RepID=A0A6N2N3R2_SALVM